MYLVDTNVISEFRKIRAGRANVGVVEWAGEVRPTTLFLSAITVSELEFGVQRLERVDEAQGRVLRAWLDEGVLRTFADRITDVDARVARKAAEFSVPDPAPLSDALIAATAAVHGFTVVTRNIRDFTSFAGVDVLNPWR